MYFFLRATACYSAYMLSPVRLSVRLSDWCIIKKRLKLRLWNFPSSFCGISFVQKF